MTQSMWATFESKTGVSHIDILSIIGIETDRHANSFTLYTVHHVFDFDFSEANKDELERVIRMRQNYLIAK